MSHAQPLKTPFRRAKATEERAVQYTSAGQLTGLRTIGQLLLLKNIPDKKVCRATSDAPKTLVTSRPLACLIIRVQKMSSLPRLPAWTFLIL